MIIPDFQGMTDYWPIRLKFPKLGRFQTYLYALCASDGKPVYIGLSSDAIKRRNMHRNQPLTDEMKAWIDSIGKEAVCVKILGIFELDEGTRAEITLIRALAANGTRLFNLVGVKSRSEIRAIHAERERQYEEEQRQSKLRWQQWAIEQDQRRLGLIGMVLLLQKSAQAIDDEASPKDEELKYEYEQ
jgi:hypothetical protein